MPLVRDRCICLRKTEYSETSQILTLLSRDHGIARLIAKGAHRRTKAGASRFDGGIDLLDCGDAVFQHDTARDLPPLTEWSLHDGHLALRKSLRGIHLGLYAAELVGRLIEEHDPHPGIFHLMERTLAELADERREEMFLVFELDLLRDSGHLPELFACVRCGRTTSETPAGFFSPSRGGVICRDCEREFSDRTPIDPRLLRLVQGVLRLARSDGSPLRLPRLTRHQTDPINRMLADHVQHTLGRPLRLPRYVLGRDS